MQTLRSPEMIMLWAIVGYMEQETKRASRNVKLPKTFRGGSYIPLRSGMLFNQSNGEGLYNYWVDQLGTEDDIISHPMQFSRITDRLEKAGLVETEHWTATPDGIRVYEDYLQDKEQWNPHLCVSNGIVVSVGSRW